MLAYDASTPASAALTAVARCRSTPDVLPEVMATLRTSRLRPMDTPMTRIVTTNAEPRWVSSFVCGGLMAVS
jgi:hypothetical protein